MRVIVLGAGVVGVASAWYLAADGHEVTVIDRQPAPAMETSFANGGQISVSHAEPWAHPGAPWLALRWMWREDAPLLWRWSADADQWRWGLRFLRECAAARTQANMAALVSLGLSSRSALQDLRRDLSLDYDQRQCGILHFYTNQRDMERALPQAALMTEYGCESVPKTAAECLALEPALQQSRVAVVGGTYAPADESGDARKFTTELQARTVERGVDFRFGSEVQALERNNRGDVTGVRLSSGEVIEADATVVALGAYSPLLLRPLGIRLPVVPAKGYSATLNIPSNVTAPVVSLTDDAHKIVISRLGERLRVAGTAEFAGYDASLTPSRCKALLQRAHALFPQLAGVTEVEFWAGLRPATPGNVPLIGDLSAQGLRGLWLNTGHGTLGWTLACGSGQLLANLLARRDPGLDSLPYSL